MFTIMSIGECIFKINAVTGETWKLMGTGLANPVWCAVKEKV